MSKKVLCVLLFLAVIIGICGAALSVGMLIRAVQWSEWGRVVLYSVTTALSVEMAVLSIGRLKNKETA